MGFSAEFNPIYNLSKSSLYKAKNLLEEIILLIEDL